MSAADRPGEPTASTAGTVMALIVQGAKRLAIGDRVYEYRAGQYLVASVDLPITGHYSQASPTAPALGFGLILRPSAIASLLLDAPASRSAPTRPQSVAAPPGLGVADASPELLDAAIRMLRLLDAPRNQPVLAPMIEREILWRLMTGPLAQTVRQIGIARQQPDPDQPRCALDSPTTPTSHPRRRARSILWHEHLGLSPQLSRRDRPEPDPVPKTDPPSEIRLLLMSGAADVAATGYRVGYGSTAQFNGEYRRQFGVPPDATPRAYGPKPTSPDPRPDVVRPRVPHPLGHLTTATNVPAEPRKQGTGDCRNVARLWEYRGRLPGLRHFGDGTRFHTG